jgi:dTDP-4-dehydrorhamnose 3,5-epimerase
MPKNPPGFRIGRVFWSAFTEAELRAGMKFEKTKLNEVFEIHIEPIRDERGFFARTWCQSEFEKRNLAARLVQCNVSSSVRKGTLRGLHYQAAPFPETKIIRCIKGAMFVVALDLRPQSSTFKNWFGVELSATNRKMLYIPEGCAQGFLTLEDETEGLYQISEFHHPDLARGVRWNDPAFRIEWPGEVNIISDRDKAYPDFV